MQIYPDIVEVAFTISIFLNSFPCGKPFVSNSTPSCTQCQPKISIWSWRSRLLWKWSKQRQLFCVQKACINALKDICHSFSVGFILKTNKLLKCYSHVGCIVQGGIFWLWHQRGKEGHFSSLTKVEIFVLKQFIALYWYPREKTILKNAQLTNLNIILDILHLLCLPDHIQQNKHCICL